MKVIMTASRKANDYRTNVKHNAAMLLTIDQTLHITGIPTTGIWEGEREQSYAFYGVKHGDIMFLHMLANQYEQDAILVVRDDNRACLVYGSGEVQEVGDWHKVRHDIAIMFDGYSIIGGEYFVAATHAELANAERRLAATQANVIAANEYRRVNGVLA